MTIADKAGDIASTLNRKAAELKERAGSTVEPEYRAETVEATGEDLPGALRLAYKPIGIVSGLVGGLIAGQVFDQIWKRISNEDETPEPLSPKYSTREVLLAATLQGAIFGLIRTAVNRYGMKAYRKAVFTPIPASSRKP
ncbi:MAG: DUF4235 domain-containing protein [Pseudonocardia sp.]|nr:DUF4235 domain-containing protein [Pseudonocardia sp.]